MGTYRYVQQLLFLIQDYGNVHFGKGYYIVVSVCGNNIENFSHQISVLLEVHFLHFVTGKLLNASIAAYNNFEFKLF